MHESQFPSGGRYPLQERRHLTGPCDERPDPWAQYPGTATGEQTRLRAVDTVPDTRPASEPAPEPALDVVIPALNEAHRIGTTIESICRHMVRSGRTVRIIVVDNGSVDGTAQVVDRTDLHGMDARVISCQIPGKGAAVKAGVRTATAPLVGYVDADRSSPPDALVTAVAILDSGWDVVVGSRRAFGASYVVPQSLVRRFGSRAFNLAASTLVGRMRDTQCGMKVFRTAAARDVFESVALGGFTFDVEVLARALAANLRIMEIPVSWSDDAGSSFRPLRHGVQAFGELYRLHRVLRAPQ